jgi:hypothetical protein
VPLPSVVMTNPDPAREVEPAGRLPDASATPPARSEAWKSWVGKALFEAALIVFSVLLALTLDEWREDAAERARFAEAVHSLADEVKFNRELLAGAFYVDHHRRLLEHYQSRASAGGSEDADEAFKTGLHPAPLRDTAWATLGDSGVARLLPFGLRADLGGIYRDQTSLDEMFRTLVFGLTQPRTDRETAAYKRDQIRVMALSLTSMVATENRLLLGYAEVEPKLRALVR